MDRIDWLMFANITVWLGLGAYLAFISLRQGALLKRLVRLETLDANNEGSK